MEKKPIKRREEIQRRLMLEYVEELRNKAKWHQDQINNIRRKLKMYSKMLDIAIAL